LLELADHADDGLAPVEALAGVVEPSEEVLATEPIGRPPDRVQELPDARLVEGHRCPDPLRADPLRADTLREVAPDDR
jgi:hypothetical protein